MKYFSIIFLCYTLISCQRSNSDLIKKQIDQIQNDFNSIETIYSSSEKSTLTDSIVKIKKRQLRNLSWEVNSKLYDLSQKLIEIDEPKDIRNAKKKGLL